MSFTQLILLACGLAMDACAVAAARGVQYRFTLRQALFLTLSFGVFQAGMPALGWLMGTALRGFIHGFAPWVAFVVLAIIGGKMIWEGWRGGDDDAARPANPFAVGTVLLLAVATSIDALAVGVSLSLLDVDLAWSVTVIGTVTFALSFAAMYAGRLVGSMLSGRLDILGGLILVGIGVKILVEHLLA